MIFNEEAVPETKHDWAFTRLIVLIVPVTATANVLGLWLSPPVAWGISTLGWTLVVYWFPSKPRIPFVKWIFLSLLFAIAASLFAAVK